MELSNWQDPARPKTKDLAEGLSPKMVLPPHHSTPSTPPTHSQLSYRMKSQEFLSHTLSDQSEKSDVIEIFIYEVSV